ncbi:MAG TPA: amino acid adenylation domain-containing protein [Rubrobacteraceae bacterium]|nr:amino acid adenylation domain-containing protein [Rubrobacteraceae bacterium]
MSGNPTDRCLHEIFEEQARRTPEALALVDQHTSLTYAELDRRADLLAIRLRRSGVGPGELVGVYMERRAEYVVACLAALKSGGAYLTLELAYPPSLLEEVISDADPRIVLTRESYTERLPDGVERFCLDEGWETGLEEALEDAPAEDARVSQENLAFVSYSSGTTGKPKGIANPHRAPVRSYLWRFGVSDYSPGDRVGCNVFFIWEMLRPLLRGAATVVIPDDVIYDPNALVRFLREYEVTETLVTPSLLEAVLDASGPEIGDRLPALRTVWLNGEVVTRTLARRAMSLLPDTRFLNVYSCSETHEVAAGDLRELVENPDSTYCPVGLPMDPERLYVLDEEGRTVPDGEAGELFVGGECLARGYVNLPEKTEESFPEDPFSSVSGARMYRSGDRARILSDGSLEIMGRVDFMVKIRGYSVELGAVEAAIEKDLAVRTCVAIAEGGEGEDKRLVAYLVPDPEDGERYSGWDLDPKTGRSRGIRAALRDSLPHYAVPAVFVELESLPIQATSGKVDRDELPPPPPRPSRAAPDPHRSAMELPADAPRSEKEALLERVWEEVLRLDEGEVRPEDDFFDLGGHSLAAAQLSGRVEESFGVHVSMPLFMEDPTVGGLCDRIESLQRGGSNDAARISADDLRAEAVLDPEIIPERADAGGAKTLRDARNVFLTGATGFLGAFLLDGLLSSTEARVHCLIRPRGDEDSLETIRANLRDYGLDGAARSERVVAVPGDLGEPLLGIDERDFDALARETDVVIHAGAVVNLVYPYSVLKAANVGGTREVLRLACRHRVKPVHYVSTNGIFPSGRGLCEEDADLDALAGGREDGYGQSKWVAERLVREAAERGVPVSVYRPGNISGHSASGSSNPRDLLGAVVVESLRLGAAPEVEGWRMEMTPVDFVAAAILHIASDSEAVDGNYHLANPDPIHASEFFDRLEELGYPLERLPYPEWLDAVKDVPHRDDDVTGGVLRGASPEDDEIWDGNIYDDRNTREALRGGGPQRPVFDTELIETYARYFVEQGWVEAPAALQEANRRG